MSTRPARFKTNDELSILIDNYFDVFLGESGEIADIESIADYLKINRQTLLQYERKQIVSLDEIEAEKIRCTIKNAKNKIAKIKKQMALKGLINSAIFCFDFKNNHNYVDQQQVESTNINNNININNNVDNLTSDERKARIDELLRKLAQ